MCFLFYNLYCCLQWHFLLSHFPYPSWYLGILMTCGLFPLNVITDAFLDVPLFFPHLFAISYTRIVYAMLDAVTLYIKVFVRFDLLHCGKRWLPIAWLTYLSRNCRKCSTWSYVGVQSWGSHAHSLVYVKIFPM